MVCSCMQPPLFSVPVGGNINNFIFLSAVGETAGAVSLQLYSIVLAGPALGVPCASATPDTVFLFFFPSMN